MTRILVLSLLVACSGGGGDDDKGGGGNNGGGGGTGTDTATTSGRTDSGPTDDTGHTGAIDTVVRTDSGRAVITDRYLQASPAAVDLLFVIDDSCSMGPRQAELAEAFPSFMNYLLGSGIDYHIGVTSTSVTSQAASCNVGNALDGRLAEVQGIKWIDPDTPDPTQVFSQLALLGDGGSGCEQGLGAAKRALDDRANGANAGFLRDEAELHTVVLSDEEDQTENQIVQLQDFISWYQGLKADPDHTHFHSFVCTTPGVVGGYGAGCFTDTIGDRYLSVTDAVGGTVVDILELDDAAIEGLGLSTAGLARSFVLSATPVDGTIEVEVLLAKLLLELDEGNEWFFDASANSVVFIDYVPDPGAEVVIRYVAQ